MPAIAALMNRAYRGQAGGWTTEAGYITGLRTTEALLHDELARVPEARPLVWRRRDGSLLGFVWLAPQDSGTWYLGSLTIDPAEQGAGQGRRLLAAAEATVVARGGVEVTMTVVHLRDTLLAWYARRGYRLTGETLPFPYGDERFGTPMRPDLRFVVLRKRLDAP